MVPDAAAVAVTFRLNVQLAPGARVPPLKAMLVLPATATMLAGGEAQLLFKPLGVDTTSPFGNSAASVNAIPVNVTGGFGATFGLLIVKVSVVVSPFWREG